MNRGPLDRALAALEGELAELRAILARADREALRAFLTEAAAFRRPLDGRLTARRLHRPPPVLLICLPLPRTVLFACAWQDRGASSRGSPG